MDKKQKDYQVEKPEKSKERKDRLAKALRDNLQKRKQQLKQRKQSSDTPSG